MKSRKKKSIKAVTLLSKIEALLSEVMAEYSAIEKSVEKNVQGLLRSAEASIATAKEFIIPAPSSAVPRKAARNRTRPASLKSKARPSVRARKRSIVRAA